MCAGFGALMTFHLSAVCCWKRAAAKHFCDTIVFFKGFPVQRAEKIKCESEIVFENFFQMTVVGQNLLIFLVVFRINSRDFLSSAHVSAVSVSCNRREKRCFIFHWMLLLCLMLWAAENQKKTTNTAGGEVCVNRGGKRSGESRFYCKIYGKHESDLFFVVVVVVLSLTYLYKHNFCLPMLQSLPSFLNCPLAHLL